MPAGLRSGPSSGSTWPDVHLRDRTRVHGGSAKGPSGWFDVTTATVYFDHPVHAPFVHSLNIDFLNA